MNVPQDHLTDALDRLLALVVILGEDMSGALEAQGLTTARTHLLWVVHHGGPSTQRALADALAVSPRNITGLVDGLVASGHVSREPHPVDRRATLVTLTDDGRRLMTSMVEEHRQLAHRLFGELTPRRLEAFVAGVEHVTARLQEGIA